MVSKVQQALKAAGKQLDKAEKKQVKSDCSELERYLTKLRVEKVTQAEIDNIAQAKTRLEASSAHLLSNW